jgi:hypothetical protein
VGGAPAGVTYDVAAVRRPEGPGELQLGEAKQPGAG